MSPPSHNDRISPVRPIPTDGCPSIDMLSVLRAIATGRRDLDLGDLTAQTLDRALSAGLGAYLAHCSSDRAGNTNSPFCPSVQAADLTGRVISGQLLDGLETVLRAASATGCRPVLLKGIATAQRYYPEPHLRTMGDIDLWVPTGLMPAVETDLRTSGFIQTARQPTSFFETHHHGMPFWHPARKVWIEIHTGLFPPWSPFANSAKFTESAIKPNLEAITFRGLPAYVFNDELQLVYSTLRWSESLDTERGICPMLDAILLLRARGHSLDWDRVASLIPQPSGAAALRLMLTYLSHHGLASVPSEVEARLVAMDRTTNSTSQRILRRMVSTYVINGKRFGRGATANNLGLIWSALLGVRPAWQNILSIPYHLVFPPGNPRRFQLSFLLGRLRSLLRRRAETS